MTEWIVSSEAVEKGGNEFRNPVLRVLAKGTRGFREFRLNRLEADESSPARSSSQCRAVVCAEDWSEAQRPRLSRIDRNRSSPVNPADSSWQSRTAARFVSQAVSRSQKLKLCFREAPLPSKTQLD